MPISRRLFIQSLAASVAAPHVLAAESPTTAPVDHNKDVVKLFDGKSLDHWKATDFGGQGEVKVENGMLLITHGETLTGVTWQGAVPAKMNYEIELDAQRLDGNDFFVGLTFPYNNDSASLILGGWGGGVCGISCIDENDAARNDTTTIHEFHSDKWYHVRLRVTPDKIQAWLGDEQIVDADVKGKRIAVRSEVEASQPLGLATYQTTGEFKNFVLRKLPADSK